MLLCPWNFPGNKNWGGLPFPIPWDLSEPGREPVSLSSPALAGGFLTNCITGKAHQSEEPTSKSQEIINARESLEKREPSYTVGGNVN